MEAAWGGSSLRLDADSLTLKEAGAAPIAIPLRELRGFTLVDTAPLQAGKATASTPDAELVVGWQAHGKAHSARMPVPREALQVQLFLARLAQVRPEADLRALPTQQALQRLGVGGRGGPLILVAALVLLAVLLVAGLLLR
jgi:hypothetical protein